MALEAQKKEREKYKQLLQLAIQNEVLSEQQNSLYKSTKQEEPEVHEPEEPNGHDTFFHTHVDIVDSNIRQGKVARTGGMAAPSGGS